MTTFQIVTQMARKAEVIETLTAPLVEFEERGFRFTGQYQTGTQLREELRGQPKFEGLCGPMWGGTTAEGDPIIRYEDWDSYNVLSR